MFLNRWGFATKQLQHLHEVIKQDGLAFENQVFASGNRHVRQMEGINSPVTGTE